MAGSLQARAEKYGKEEYPSIEPDVCPQDKRVNALPPHCLYVYGHKHIAVCPYAYAFTDGSDPTVRMDVEEIVLEMDRAAMSHYRVRVLCLIARAVDRAGA